MNIAVLSGKGGTGKTFASVNLASVSNATYLDCDVEAPNGSLFLKPEKLEVQNVYKLMPQVDLNKCIKCRKCMDNCKFNAIAFVKKPIFFENICHSCGACKYICPTNAISERKEIAGTLEIGNVGKIKVVTGKLKLGEASGVKIINKVLENGDGLNIIDCPPGSACSVIECVNSADYCVIVAEPTIFGLHNFEMVLELCQLLNKPIGVIVNKYNDKNNIVTEFCKKNNLKILANIPFKENLAESNANGVVASSVDSEIKEIFEDVFDKIKKQVIK